MNTLLKSVLPVLAGVAIISANALADGHERHEKGAHHNHHARKAHKKIGKRHKRRAHKIRRTVGYVHAEKLARNIPSVDKQSLQPDGASFAHDREELMEAAQMARKTAGAMIRGRTPWNSKIAELAMRTIQSVGLAFGHKVPEGSLTDESDASPEIWKNMADFQRHVDELEERSDAAAKAARKGPENFRPAFLSTLEACQACHKKYRLKKKS